MVKTSLTRKLTFGVFSLLSGSALASFLNVVTLAFVARKLGVGSFGLYSAIYAFVGLFQFLSNLGVNRALLKEGSTNFEKARISFGNILFLKFALILPLSFLIGVCGYFSGYRGEEQIILQIFSLSIIFDSFGSIFISVRRILGDFTIISYARVARNIINFILVFLAFKIQTSIYSLAIATIIISFFSFFISLINTIFLLKPKYNLKLLPSILKDSMIFSFDDFFSKIYLRLSVVMLSFFKDFNTVGLFSAAIRFTKLASIFPKQVRIALLPSIYRILEGKDVECKKEEINQLIESNHDRSKRVFKTILKYMSILVVPFVIVIYYFSDDVTNIVFGNKYLKSIPLVKILSLFIYIRFLQNPFTLFYLGLNRHKIMVILEGISSFSLVIFHLILIPSFAAYGACYAIIISELTFLVLLLIYGMKFSIWNLKNSLTLIFYPFVSGLISIFLIENFLGSFHVFLKIFFVPFLYLIILVITKQLNKKDKELLKSIILNRKK